MWLLCELLSWEQYSQALSTSAGLTFVCGSYESRLSCSMWGLSLVKDRRFACCNCTTVLTQAVLCSSFDQRELWQISLHLFRVWSVQLSSSFSLPLAFPFISSSSLCPYSYCSLIFSPLPSSTMSHWLVFIAAALALPYNQNKNWLHLQLRRQRHSLEQFQANTPRQPLQRHGVHGPPFCWCCG